MSLAKIQKELKAPKKQHNKFGNYNYRNLEDIVEAAKPLLSQEGFVLKMSDEIVHIGERFYVRATVSIKQGEKTIEETVAYAREAASKKGMDESQITGTASSYARKYALNGLFAIDDTKDSDAQDNRPPELNKTQMKYADQMVAATSYDELQRIWTKLSEKNREALRDTANSAREKLNGNHPK